MLSVAFRIVGGATLVFLFCSIVGYWLHQKAQGHPPLQRFGKILFRGLLTGQLGLIVPLLLYEDENIGRSFASFNEFLGIVGGWTLLLTAGCVWYWRHEERARRYWESQEEEDRSVEFECYYCGERIQSPGTSIGQETVCHGCENALIVPPVCRHPMNS